MSRFLIGAVIGLATFFQTSWGVDAQSFDLRESFMLGNGRTVDSVYSTPADIVNQVIPVAFVAGGIVFLAVIIYNGVMLAVKPGTPQTVENAKKYITTALIGLIIMVCAFWIVEVVTFVTGTDDIGILE